MTDKSRGFFTIAFGKHYQKIAYNLLLTARYNNLKYPFAIITDKSNKYTKKFDLEIIRKPVANGYLNKLYIDLYAPYEESIFIDADSLIVKDISFFFDLIFDKDDEYAAFGINEDLAHISKKSYFNPLKIKKYNLNYAPRFDSCIYFYSNNRKLKNVFLYARKFYDSKVNYDFRFQNGDEPYVSLAMAINNVKCFNLNPILKWDFITKKNKIDLIKHTINGCNMENKLVCHISTLQTYGTFYKETIGQLKYKNSILYPFYKLKIFYLISATLNFFKNLCIK